MKEFEGKVALVTGGGSGIGRATAAGSGDLAYSTGAYQMSAPDDSGKSSIDRGKYVAVWKKQTDGNWKVAVDIWNTDLPLPAPSDKK